MTIRRKGFSLLEVLIALAILAVSLTALFSGEAGAVKMAYRARRIGVATLLARCKMGEIEEQVALEGLPAVSDVGSDECCEDAEVEGFRCDWEIERIVLPESMFAPEEGDDTADSDALSALAAPGADPTKAADSILSDPASLMAGGGSAMGGMTGMAMSYVFPILKPSFEEQVRRATVTVRWTEGDRPHSFDVTQYLVADQPKLPDSNMPGAPGSQTPGGQTPGGQTPGGQTPGQAPQTPQRPAGFGGLLGGGR